MALRISVVQSEDRDQRWGDSATAEFTNSVQYRIFAYSTTESAFKIWPPARELYKIDIYFGAKFSNLGKLGNNVGSSHTLFAIPSVSHLRLIEFSDIQRGAQNVKVQPRDLITASPYQNTFCIPFNLLA
jgi:hypothetical protein